MTKIKKILVVCTGNSCRSPMAEAFLKHYLKSEGGFEIISVGTSAIDGLGPTPEAIEVMKEDEIDISSYITKPFQDVLARHADIILAMSGTHKDFVLKKSPDTRGKVYLFKEFAGVGGPIKDIDDPIGQPISVYRNVREEIKKTAIEIARRIKQEFSS